MNNDLISRKWLTDAIRNRRTYLSYEDAKDVIDLINNAPTVKAFTEEDMAGAYNEGFMCGNKEEEKKLIELFNKYDVLLVHIDGKISPVKNTSKQECYNLLYDIQELIEWRKLLFQKHMRSIDNG